MLIFYKQEAPDGATLNGPLSFISNQVLSSILPSAFHQSLMAHQALDDGLCNF
jgi:hypothetical protein